MLWPWTPSQSHGDDAWECLACARMYLEAMNIVSGGPDAAALARRARARRASRMLVTEELASDDMGPPGHRCEPRSSPLQGLPRQRGAAKDH
jgi:hypothetical protein